MQNLGLVLLVFAFVFALIAACFAEDIRGFKIGWVAVTFWIAAELFGGLARAFH